MVTTICMRLTHFWAKGYRSLVDVDLTDLQAANVFYGPNGSGKSNVLAAISTFLDLVRELFRALDGEQSVENSEGRPHGRPTKRGRGLRAMQPVSIARRDFNRRDPSAITLGGQLGSAPESGLVIEFVVERGRAEELSVMLRKLALPESGDIAEALYAGELKAEVLAAFSAGLPATQIIESSGFLVTADRFPREELGTIDVGRKGATSHSDLVFSLLRDRRLKEAFFRAQNSPDSDVRRRLRRLKEFLRKRPLERPDFTVVHDAQKGEFDLREQLPPPNPDEADISLDLAGLGVVQVYSILGQIFLGALRLVGIEEPEAHLHAQTTGRFLRQILERLLDEGDVDQVFIATHSNLFDLDPTGYWDVRLDNGTTHVRRGPLEQIDALHLYEPGPAKHAIHAFLSYLPPEEVVFRRPDGKAISAGEMLGMLQRDDEDAVAFLRDVHGAAVRAVRVRAKGKPPG
jgi:hypothetical protein